MAFIPTLHAPFALVSILIMTLGRGTYSVCENLNHFSFANFITLYIGAFALILCGDGVLHTMMMLMIIASLLQGRDFRTIIVNTE